MIKVFLIIVGLIAASQSDCSGNNELDGLATGSFAFTQVSRHSQLHLRIRRQPPQHSYTNSQNHSQPSQRLPSVFMRWFRYLGCKLRLFAKQPFRIIRCACQRCIKVRFDNWIRSLSECMEITPCQLLGEHQKGFHNWYFQFG